MNGWVLLGRTGNWRTTVNYANRDRMAMLSRFASKLCTSAKVLGDWY
jgi:hypothetical protein